MIRKMLANADWNRIAERAAAVWAVAFIAYFVWEASRL